MGLLRSRAWWTPRCWNGSPRAARNWTGWKKQLVKQLEQVRAERDGLAVAERVLARMSEQVAGERAAVMPASAQVGAAKAAA
ncbi:hypothetical protein [Streptomyces sp. NPDC086023]|uniref:hypothetical protein n=1 Tax=Streptomyces sp. NPDC086023 TaxID=3365746 RepID=UPI0037D2BCC0